jgi:uncharacterized BrkB/YihY/UPF0761 family membrane protein
MNRLKALLAAMDRWQHHNDVAGPGWAVLKKFGDDKANLYVVALGWYGFTAIYPLLLVVVAVLGFIGQASLGTSTLHTLQKFPVIGPQFTPGSGGKQLHGSVFGLVIGIVGLIYGAQGVTQTAQQAFSRTWNIPEVDRPGFVPRLGRSLGGLILIGLAFLLTAAFGSYATAHGEALWLRVLVIVALAAVNVGFYQATFRVLTPPEAPTRALLPGAVFGGLCFTALTTVGTGLMSHMLAGKSATYGAFAAVLGVVTFLLLLAKLSIYGAELNPILHRHLWPRALPTCEPTDADQQVLHDRTHEQRQRPEQRIGVGFDEHAPEEARIDASRTDDHAKQPDLDAPAR